MNNKKKLSIVIVLFIIIFTILFFLNKLKDEFWYHEYTYTLKGFYEDDYYSDDIKSSKFDQVYSLEDLANKDIVVGNGHYITVKVNGSHSKNARLRIKLKNPQMNGQLVSIGCFYDNTYYNFYKNSIKKYLSLECVLPQAEDTIFYIYNHSADPISFEQFSVKFY